MATSQGMWPVTAVHETGSSASFSGQESSTAVTKRAEEINETNYEGSCMGFSVRSSVQLSYLRSGSSQKTIMIDEMAEPSGRLPLLQEWPSSQGNPALRLLEAGDDLVVENNRMGRFRISADRSTLTVPPAKGTPGALREAFMWSTPFAVAGSDLNHLVIHAASVSVNENAILLVGDTRAGKTTLAHAFHVAGHRLLSDDGARCHVGEKTVYPGPALLRLRRDIASGADLRDLELTHTANEKTHLAISQPRRGDGLPIPISAIAFLTWGSHITRRLSIEEAIGLMWRMVFYLPTDETAIGAFKSLGELVGAVPVFEVSRPKVRSETGSVVERLMDICLG